MNRTYTPELAPDVLDRLASYAGRFRDNFGHPRQAIYCGVYPQGLLLDGERKSIVLSASLRCEMALFFSDL